MGNVYNVGDAPRITIALNKSDDDGGGAVDPATLIVKVKDPTGTETTYTYGTDSALVKDEVGSYHIDVPVNAAGHWRWRVAATTPNAALEGDFSVKPSNF